MIENLFYTLAEITQTPEFQALCGRHPMLAEHLRAYQQIVYANPEEVPGLIAEAKALDTVSDRIRSIIAQSD